MQRSIPLAPIPIRHDLLTEEAAAAVTAFNERLAALAVERATADGKVTRARNLVLDGAGDVTKHIKTAQDTRLVLLRLDAKEVALAVEKAELVEAIVRPAVREKIEQTKDSLFSRKAQLAQALAAVGATSRWCPGITQDDAELRRLTVELGGWRELLRTPPLSANDDERVVALRERLAKVFEA